MPLTHLAGKYAVVCFVSPPMDIRKEDQMADQDKFPPSAGSPHSRDTSPSTPFNASLSDTADSLRRRDINYTQAPGQAGPQTTETPPLTAPVSPFGNNRNPSTSKDAIAAGPETVPMQSAQRDMGRGGNQ